METILDKVLTEKPNEIYIPQSRGWLIHFGNLTYGTWLYRLIDKFVYAQGVSGVRTFSFYLNNYVEAKGFETEETNLKRVAIVRNFLL